ncbi:MAG: tRNA (adenosine(37)-N6)-threonylcarbamoyltransferase complex ATPase subunit type 1 TsaE [Dokdonella sp.]
MNRDAPGMERFARASIDEAQLEALAARLAPAARKGGLIHLAGDLGAGKTTFARALLQALGVGERIKSPTYSLIESYRVGELDIHHLDLYRIADAGELEWLGLGDLWGVGTLVLIEWPERGTGHLPPPDLAIELQHARNARALTVLAGSDRGREMLLVWRVTDDSGFTSVI